MLDNYSWWNDTNVARAGTTRGSIDQIAMFALLSSALKNNLCVYEHSNEGNIIDSVDFLRDINALNGRCISRSITNESRHEIMDSSDYVFVWPDGVLTISFDSTDWVYLKSVSLNMNLIERIKDTSEKNITHKTKGRAYVFVSGPHGPELKQLSGNAGIELERKNYTPDVLDDFDHIVKDLQSEKPCGRVSIISGVPGSGKTFIVRAITEAVSDAMFVLVPPSMISDMMSPQFIPVLIDHHKSSKQPIVFVLEDADTCLVERGPDNMTTISSLLNLGDGIFGSMFNIKIIATTNAKRLDIDPAITRAGRCCRYTEVGPIPRKQTEEIYKRLVGDLAEIKDGIYYNNSCPAVLGDIYSAAYEVLNGTKQKQEIVKKLNDKAGFNV